MNRIGTYVSAIMLVCLLASVRAHAGGQAEPDVQVPTAIRAERGSEWVEQFVGAMTNGLAAGPPAAEALQLVLQRVEVESLPSDPVKAAGLLSPLVRNAELELRSGRSPQAVGAAMRQSVGLMAQGWDGDTRDVGPPAAANRARAKVSSILEDLAPVPGSVPMITGVPIDGTTPGETPGDDPTGGRPGG